MKKISINFLLILLLAVTDRGQAQSVLKINIISPIFRTLNMQFEQTHAESSSVQLGLFYTGFSTEISRWRGYGITPEFRYYLSETSAPQGVFVAPFIRFQKIKAEEKDTNFSSSLIGIGGGIIIGRQWIFKDKISLEAFLGPSYTSVKVSGESNEDFGEIDGFGLRAGVCLGVKF